MMPKDPRPAESPTKRELKVAMAKPETSAGPRASEELDDPLDAGPRPGLTGSTPAGPLNEETYEAFFSRLSGGRAPYGYQVRMANRLQADRHILLTAPTGCGKTLATLAPFLHARSTGRPFADRVLYTLPLRALAASLKRDTEKLLKDAGIPATVTIQTGDQSEDELFNRGDIVFTTIDQLLSAYLHMPLSLPDRLANINAGALVGSLIVFDEAHLLEPDHALKTLLHLLSTHDHLARLVIATATFTSPARQAMLQLFPGRVVEEGLQPGELAEIPVLATRSRRWTRVDSAITADEVRARHRRGRTLVVVNTVRRAQEIGGVLLAEPPSGAQVIVLHSRFFPHDRTPLEEEIVRLFGPRAASANVVVVATQVIEAGLDISADVLLTELAPANSLIQRAGRCARFLSPRNEGDVFVFDLQRDPHGRRRLGPYRDGETAGVVEKTWNALAGAEASVLGPDGETALLEAGLAESEASIFWRLSLQSSRRDRDRDVQEAWRTGEPSLLRRLVRDVRAVPLFLANDPSSTIDLTRWPLSLSVPTPSWRGFVKGLSARDELAAVQVLVEESDDESAWGTRWHWKAMTSPDEWGYAYCVGDRVASYPPRLGLRLSPSSEVLPPLRPRERPPGLAIHYSRESYGDHARRILRQADTWLSRHPVALRRSSDHYGIDIALLRAIVLLAAGLHDVAKLDVRWQAAARAWQEHKKGRGSESGREPLAHTDYDPRLDREAQRRPEFHRPPHAVEGALAVLPLVDSWLSDLGCHDEKTGDRLRRIVLTAIARHHSPRAGYRDGIDFRLADQYKEEVLGPFVDPTAGGFKMPSVPEIIDRPTPADRNLLREVFLRPEHPRDAEVWPLYGLVARGLRISDQAATREGSGGESHGSRVTSTT